MQKNIGSRCVHLLICYTGNPKMPDFGNKYFTNYMWYFILPNPIFSIFTTPIICICTLYKLLKYNSKYILTPITHSHFFLCLPFSNFRALLRAIFVNITRADNNKSRSEKKDAFNFITFLSSKCFQIVLEFAH